LSASQKVENIALLKVHFNLYAGFTAREVMQAAPLKLQIVDFVVNQEVSEMAQLLMQWMKLANKTEVENQPSECKSDAVACEEFVMRGQAETMRHVLTQMNQLRHF
jgi:hypothetical protein